MPKTVGSIRIETEKFLKKKKNSETYVKMRQIVEIKGVRKLRRLPRKYMENGQFLFYEKGSLMLGSLQELPIDQQSERRKFALKSEALLCPKQILLEKKFKDIHRLIVKCGDRLHQINKHEKEMKSLETWSGRETIKI